MAQSSDKRVGAIIVARSAVAAAPLAEMQAMADRIGLIGGIDVAAFAFTEQGEPPLRGVVRRLRDDGCSEIVLLPVMVPMEPSFISWITRILGRWRDAEPDNWPIVRLAPAPMQMDGFGRTVDEMVSAALSSEPAKLPVKTVIEGSVIPPQKHRVLFCMGAPCNNAGASAIWGHFRNEQIRLDLRTQGDGTMSAKTSCLGPCSLAPVVQVYPEGTYYCGVDEAGIDRIIADHLLLGKIAGDLAYEPTQGKQKLRKPATPSST